MHWLYQLVKLREKRRDFPPFPNPHIRTTAFMVERELLLELGLERPSDKRTAYLIESGRQSITRRGSEKGAARRGGGPRRSLLRRGAVVAQPHLPRERPHGQSNLLVADNRTSEWEQANPEQRRLLTHYAWGEADMGESRSTRAVARLPYSCRPPVSRHLEIRRRRAISTPPW